MLRLWLVRHAESVGNATGERGDTPLTARGEEQALALAPVLRIETIDVVYVSPLLRARQTAERALPTLDVRVDDRVREFEPLSSLYVDPSGQTPAQLIATLSAMKRDSDTHEDGPAFVARVDDFLADLPAAGSVCVVSHFGVLRQIIGRMLTFRDAPQVLDNGVAYRLDVGDDVNPSQLLRIAPDQDRE